MKILAETCPLPDEEGTTDLLFEGAPYRVHLGTAEPPPRSAPRRRRDRPPVPDERLEEARRMWDEVSRPTERGDMVPFVVSTSDLLRFSACPLAYFWSNLVGTWGGRRPRAEEETPVPRPGEDEITDREDRRRMGTLVHALLETGSFREGPEEDEIRRGFAEEFQRDPRPEETAEVHRLVESFLGSDWGRLAADLEAADPGAVIREQPFHLRHEDLLIKGTVDLLLRVPEDRPVVIDYKTGVPAGRAMEDDPYVLQMRIYALAVESILREPCRAVLFYLADGESQEIPEGGGDVTRCVRSFREAHEGTPPGGGPAPHFPASPAGSRCRVCDFRTTCSEASTS
jgi:CRISPR/Cas system-associated exonuclease Cas4 (RecB family)